MILRMPLDLKSLYLNIKNDNLTGHTATVATPLKQGNSIHEELARIYQISESIPESSKEKLSLHILSKSRAEAKIVKICVFDRVTVNGIPVNSDFQYCIYIREETDPDNVHCGRQKVHYPQVLEFEDDNVSINNAAVIKAVSETIKNYAFVVQAFEYDTDTKELNFDALIIGEKNIPYSKVFAIKRGVGEKFASVFNEYADIYDTEIIAMRNRLGYEKVYPENFMEVMDVNKKKAVALVKDDLQKHGATDCSILSERYPYSLYDIEIREVMKKKYVTVRFTSTNLRYFNLPANIISFVSEFHEQAQIALVTDVNGSPSIRYYGSKEIGNMKKTICSVSFEERG